MKTARLLSLRADPPNEDMKLFAISYLQWGLVFNEARLGWSSIVLKFQGYPNKDGPLLRGLIVPGCLLQEYSQGSLLTHLFSIGGRSKHANCIHRSVIPSPTVLTRYLLLFTFVPHDSTNCASTSVLLMFLDSQEFFPLCISDRKRNRIGEETQ